MQPGYLDLFGKKRKRSRKHRRRADAQQCNSSSPQARPAALSASGCPLRHFAVLGGLIPLTDKGRLACPPFVIAVRAAVAKLPPVQQLRPQALPLRLLAIGMICIISLRESLKACIVCHAYERFASGSFDFFSGANTLL